MANRAPTVGRGDDALFVEDGVPVKFCFHKSVTQGRGQITRDVERHGGQIVPHERLANVLLVDEQEDLAFLRRRYYSSTELHRLSLYVEPRGFVQACIRSGTYRHVGPLKQGMPGRAPGAGRARVPFTEEDRDHLAYYIATRCPTRDGRMGNSAYKDLERLGQSEDQSWAWARRHTFHSWREHYKMNPVAMDVRVDHYLQRLKDVGHHLGHDPRRHDRWNLRQEEEEDDDDEGEEEEEDEEEDQGRGLEQQDREGREQVRPAVAERRSDQAASDYLARHEQDLVAFDEEEDDGIQEGVAIQEPQRVKRRRIHPDAHRQRDFRETQAKRVRVSDGSTNERRASGVETGHSEGSLAREEDTDEEESPEIEGSDLFGDRAHDDKSRFDSDEIDLPMSFSPRASPVPEQDGPPLSTQATLIASPHSAEKERAPASSPPPTKAVEVALEPIVPPSSQQTLVMTQERVILQRARARGASAQPGPSMPKETRTQGGAAAVDVPYRNTRARSRSVDPQPEPGFQLPRRRQDQGGRGKGKARAEMPVSIEEDIDAEEGQKEGYAEEDVGPVSVTVRETFEDEMAVEGLLEASIRGEEDRVSEVSEHGEDDGSSDEDEDGDMMPELPRFQEIEIEDEPPDSDDAETHASLVRGVVGEGPADGGDASQGGESRSDEDRDPNEGDEDSDDDDADRIKRMASGSLHAAPAPIPPRRVTRSMAASQTRTDTQQVSPRLTRLGKQARAAPRATGFPSPGTKARAVVDRFQEEEKRMPYAPPLGTRAARAVKGRGRRV